MLTSRLRMFAGPNGSGKSTLKSYLPLELLGVYLNPDEIEERIRTEGFLDLATYGVMPTADEPLAFFRNSSLLKSSGLGHVSERILFSNGRLDFSNITVDSYIASVAVDFLRRKLLEIRVSFTFETVMSHPSKLELLADARSAGYRTYLYFVATADPAINVSRVKNRVNLGGHSVPQDRIENRYYRSLELLLPAVRLANRAYIFDNSGDNADRKHTWIAEITNGNEFELKTNQVPAWFKKAVLDKVERAN